MDTRARLLTAAQELIWERGVAATSPAMLLQRSGAGQGSLYHFFDGKAGWAAEAITRVAAELQAEADDALAGNPAGLAAIERYLRRPRNAVLGCRLGRLAFDPDVIADDRLRAPIAGYFARLRRLLARAVRDAVRQGELPAATDATALAEALAAVVQGAYVTGRVGDDAAAMRRATRAMRALLHAAGAGVQR
jgi:TetR/AcrR family transcriptional regulator, transcriptional repressor for nem operon